MTKFTRENLLDCHEKIKPHIHHTPVLKSQSIDNEVGAELFFKCENFQRAGSFKIRGATHAVVCLTDQQKQNGVVAHSSGNFAQAVSLAAKNAGTKACIAMPSSAPQVKLDATAAYGGEIVVTEPTAEAREETASKIVQERGSAFLHPSNDINVILGQGTAAMELFQLHQDLDLLVVPVGGGGLIAGCSLAAHFFGNGCKTIGAEPMAADDAYRSLLSGKIETNETAETVCDGLRTFLGDNNFPIIQKHVDQIVRIDEDEIVDAMKLIWQRMKIVIEPSCAVTLAAIRRAPNLFTGMKVGVILTGGNVDLDSLPW